MSDKNVGKEKMCVILDFVSRAPKGCHTLKKYHVREMGDGMIEVIDGLCKFEKEPHKACALPTSVEVDVVFDVKYIQYESDIHASCGYHRVSTIDFKGTLGACGGQVAFLERLKHECLERGSLRARLVSN